MIRRPQSSPLFPYTTLFRSLDGQPIEVDATGNVRIYISLPSNWSNSKRMDGDSTRIYFSGPDSTQPLTYDLTANTFSDVNVFGSYVNLKINSAVADGVQSFD